MIQNISQQEERISIQNYQQIHKIVNQLLEHQDIQIFQAQNFLNDLIQKQGRKNLLNKIGSTPQLHQFLLKYYIKEKYSQKLEKQHRTNKKVKTHPQVQRKEELQFTTLMKQSISTKPKTKDQDIKTLDLMDILNQQSQQIENTCEQIKLKISQLLLFKDQHKIRQIHNFITSQLINLSSFRLIVYHSNGQIYSHNSLINYVTQIFETHPKYKQIKQFSQNEQKSVVFQVNDKLQFCQIFGNSSGIGIIKVFKQQKYLMLLDTNNHIYLDDYYLNDIIITTIIIQIGWKLSQIGLLPIYQLNYQSMYHYYAKCWLELLELTLRLQSRIILKNHQKNLQITSSRQISQLTFDSLLTSQQKQNEQLILCINNYQNIIYRQLQSIRVYKKYVDQPNTIYLDFNKCGILIFITNNLQNQIKNIIKKLWNIKKIQISDIFLKNQQLQNLIKKSTKGLINNGVYHQLNQMKVKIFVNQLGYISRIHIVVLQESQGSQASFSQEKSSSTNIYSQQSEYLKSRQKANNNKLMKDLQQITPGLRNQGWISLFLKNNESQNIHQQMTRKKQIKQKRIQSQNNMTYLLNNNILQHVTSNIQNINVDNIDVNLLEIGETSLQGFAIKVITKLGFFQQLSPQKSLFVNFVKQLHQNYQVHCNPFHNFIHGVNVMHTAYLICTIPKTKQVLTPSKIFSTVFSALCHDVGHTGFTNAFQIASRSQKAITYNDYSPLQNYHASKTFELLRKPQNNFLCMLKRQQYLEIRKDIISNILNTDIKQHFPLLKRFDQKKAKDNLLSIQDSTILSGIIIHASDFGGSVKQFNISRQWSHRINQEFTNQYNQQGKLGLPQTPFMKDLNNIQVLCKNQTGFLKVIVHPLYRALNQFYLEDHKIKKLINNLNNNLERWQKIAQQFKKKQENL